MAVVNVEPELLSPLEFRKLFKPRMGERALYEHLAAGTIRGVKLGERWYIHRSEVARLMGLVPDSAVPATVEERVNGAR